MANKIAFMDIETFKSFFQIGFLIDGEYISLDMRYEAQFGEDNQDRLNDILKNYTIVGFNNLAFDNIFLNILSLRHDYTVNQLYTIAMLLVNKKYTDNLKLLVSENFEYSIAIELLKLNLFDYNIFNIMKILKTTHGYYNTIDLIKINDKGSLKFYGANMGLNIIELPYQPDKDLTNKEIDTIIDYNLNDLLVTEALYNKSIKDIEFRQELNIKHNIKTHAQPYKDFRNMGDAKIGEVFINSLLEVKQNRFLNGIITEFKLNLPSYIKFEDSKIDALFRRVVNHKFKINPKTKRVEFPKWLKDEIVIIGNNKFNLALGGLHSKEKRLKVLADKQFLQLRNIDVKSYYPYLQFVNGFTPNNINSEDYVNLGVTIFDDRAKAKAIEKKLKRKKNLTDVEKIELRDNKLINATNKIILNGGMYGKLGDTNCSYYDPKTLLNITLTGQFSLLMLIEQLDKLRGVTVLSSNTDGIEILHNSNFTEFEDIKTVVNSWEYMTGLIMEFGEYKGLYARDVNAYIANYGDYIKATGIYNGTSVNIQKKTLYPVVFRAIHELILNNTPIEETIKNEKELINFCINNKISDGGILIDDKDRIVKNEMEHKRDKNNKPVYKTIPKSKRVKIKGLDIKDYAKKHGLEDKYYFQIFDKNRPTLTPKIINGSNFNFTEFEQIGKVVRFIYVKNVNNFIVHKKSCNSVPFTNNIKLVTNHLDSYKSWKNIIDYDRYIAIAKDELKNIAYSN